LDHVSSRDIDVFIDSKKITIPKGQLTATTTGNENFNIQYRV
jgi:hypothetical protein